MEGETSIGPADPKPEPGQDRVTRATVEGVDAQNANEFDMKHGLAGAEAKGEQSDQTQVLAPTTPKAKDAAAESSSDSAPPDRVVARRTDNSAAASDKT